MCEYAAVNDRVSRCGIMSESTCGSVRLKKGIERAGEKLKIGTVSEGVTESGNHRARK
jgi:hypothetical protein